MTVKPALAALLLLGLLASAAAQGARPVTRALPPGTAEQLETNAKRLRAYQPVLEFRTSVLFLVDAVNTRRVTLSAAQAERLLPVLTDLVSLPNLTPERASQARRTIEERVLTAEQLAVIDELVLSATPPPGRAQDGLIVVGPGAGAPGAAMPSLQPLLQGRPYNPFREEDVRRRLEDFLAALQRGARPAAP